MLALFNFLLYHFEELSASEPYLAPGHLVVGLAPAEDGCGVAPGGAPQRHRRPLLHHDLAVRRLRRDRGGH